MHPHSVSSSTHLGLSWLGFLHRFRQSHAGGSNRHTFIRALPYLVLLPLTVTSSSVAIHHQRHPLGSNRMLRQTNKCLAGTTRYLAQTVMLPLCNLSKGKGGGEPIAPPLSRQAMGIRFGNFGFFSSIPHSIHIRFSPVVWKP